MKTKINIIDADAICYICSKDTLEESLLNAKDLIKNILIATKTNNFYLCFSSKPYFRNKICNLYKAKRQESTLKFLKEIKEYLINNFVTITIEGLEADDLVSILYFLFKEHKNFLPLISSTDKDVLKTIPGNHFDYKNFKQISTSEEEAILYEVKQVLIGDSTDNIKGIPGYGEKAFGKENIRIEQAFQDCLTIYIREYAKKNLSEYIAIKEFTKNYQLVHLLRNKEEVNSVGIFPEQINLPPPNTNF